MEVYLQSQTRDYSSVGTAEEVRMIETVSQLLLWDPTHGRQSKGHPAITSTAQLAGEGHSGLVQQELPVAVTSVGVTKVVVVIQL